MHRVDLWIPLGESKDEITTAVLVRFWHQLGTATFKEPFHLRVPLLLRLIFFSHLKNKNYLISKFLFTNLEITVQLGPITLQLEEAFDSLERVFGVELGDT